MKKRSDTELYDAMRDAIHYLREKRGKHPSMEEVARAVGMSSSRFEHAFREWVGVTPKRFLSHLTKERAKELLKDSGDVLRASYKAGLSSAGRLHDLFVVHDAVTPGEYKSGVITIRYGIHSSPFGWYVIGVTGRGICSMAFLKKGNEEEAVKAIKATWPKAELIRDDTHTASFHDKIFSGGKKKRMPLVLTGTNFQVKVWEALLSIPEGKVASYGDVAKLIGSPKAVRAVGSACGKNSIAFLIPCHRVLTSEGGIGGYRWGEDRKETILAWESFQA